VLSTRAPAAPSNSSLQTWVHSDAVAGAVDAVCAEQPERIAAAVMHQARAVTTLLNPTVATAELRGHFCEPFLGAFRGLFPQLDEARSSFIGEHCAGSSTPRKNAKKVLAQLFKKLYFGSLTK